MSSVCWALTSLDPPPTETANVAAVKVAGRPAHQRWSEFTASAEPYELHAAQRIIACSAHLIRAKRVDLIRLPESILSPVVFTHYGYPVLCRIPTICRMWALAP